MTSSVRRDLVLLLSENQPRSPGNPKHLNLLELRWLKNWCFSTVVLEKTLESPLDCKEIQSVHPKGDQSWVFIGRTDVEAETPILWPPDAKSWLIWKDPDAGKDWEQEEKGTTEDEMVGWHHRLDGHGFGWTPRVGDGQGGLACCDSWSCKESVGRDWTELRWFKAGLPSPSALSIIFNLSLLLFSVHHFPRLSPFGVSVKSWRVPELQFWSLQPL